MSDRARLYGRPTWSQGQLHRSRLEADVHMRLVRSGIEVEYEPEAFAAPWLRYAYLPDFRVECARLIDADQDFTLPCGEELAIPNHFTESTAFLEVKPTWTHVQDAAMPERVHAIWDNGHLVPVIVIVPGGCESGAQLRFLDETYVLEDSVNALLWCGDSFGWSDPIFLQPLTAHVRCSRGHLAVIVEPEMDASSRVMVVLHAMSGCRPCATRMRGWEL